MAPLHVVGIPGTLCSPAIFAPLGEALGDGFDLAAMGWMHGAGPWTLASVADGLAPRIPRPGSVGDRPAIVDRPATVDRPAIVVGHSTGGAIALQLALDHPELVAGLVLVDTGAHMRDHGDVDAILATMRDGWGPDLWGAVIDRSFAEPLGQDARRDFVDYAASCERQAALDVLTSQRATDFTPRLADLRCPVAVVHGRFDRVRTPEQARAFADGFTAASFTLLDCGHTPVYELPAETADIVRGVAARVAGRAML